MYEKRAPESLLFVENIDETGYMSLSIEGKKFIDYISRGFFQNGRFVAPKEEPLDDGRLLHQLNYASSPCDWYIFSHDLLSDDASYYATGFNPQYHIATDNRFEIGMALPTMPDADHNIYPDDSVLTVQGNIDGHPITASGDGLWMQVDGILVVPDKIESIDDIPRIAELAVKAKLDPKRWYLFKSKKQKFVKHHPKHKRA